MGADFAGHVLSLATALLAAEGEQAGWQEQVGAGRGALSGV